MKNLMLINLISIVYLTIISYLIIQLSLLEGELQKQKELNENIVKKYESYVNDVSNSVSKRLRK